MIRIRRATLDDRIAIHAVHAASIRRLCTGHYSADQLRRWAGFLTPEHYTAVIGDSNRHFVVAEIDGRIAGFGQLHPRTAEIEAVYVDPGHARAGVGSAILRHLERVALKESLRSLRLTATLNAIPFYERHGFRVTGHGEHRHPSGVTLRCATMTKPLGSSDDVGSGLSHTP